MAAQLKVVAGRAKPPAPVPPEDILREAVPDLIRAEAAVAALRRTIDEQRRALALKRGVAFIRPEHVRREFAQ